ncbi:DUF2309 family protein [Methylovulum psychrotolerans]|uniref:putative inorganic carbon transporter subunit DabA n=1 Tax=Methylovulum psychrotolerans TaxID=1704499 RepID=UPI001BFFA479|nr:putative inorganic carbon transporter subunit DabA [Methylovulum psychrotolerans]MBT9096245.1 DUF2309 family protein [Methylovulum psychrotolerans]
MRTPSPNDAAHVQALLHALAATAAPPSGDTLPEARYRELYWQGRITDDDLAAAFGTDPDCQTEPLSASAPSRQAVCRIALLFDLSALNPCQLAWHIEERAAFRHIQADVPTAVRRQLLAAEPEAPMLQALWAALVEMLEIPDGATDPDTRDEGTGGFIHTELRQLADTELTRLLATLGSTASLRDVVQALSGTDLKTLVDGHLRQVCTALAAAPGAWGARGQVAEGYGTWRLLARQDAGLFLQQLPDWQDIIAQLPDTAIAAIVWQLHSLDIPPRQWAAYLRHLSQELPLLPGLNPASATVLADTLAIRLTLDRLWLNQVCHDLWKIEVNAHALQSYFQKNLSEFWVRLHLYQGGLPEYLSQQAEALIIRSGSERQCRPDWQHLADVLVLRQRRLVRSPAPGDSVWRLFRLCQHLGLTARQVQGWTKTDLSALLGLLDALPLTVRATLWHAADRHHYQQALAAQPNLPHTALTPLHIIHSDSYANGLLATLIRPAAASSTLLGRAGLAHGIGRYLSAMLAAPLVLAQLLAECLGVLPNPLFSVSTEADIDRLAQWLTAQGLAQTTANKILLLTANADSPEETHRLKLLVTQLNRPETRHLLQARGIFLSADTWFLVASYDTMTGLLAWHGLETLASLV